MPSLKRIEALSMSSQRQPSTRVRQQHSHRNIQWSTDIKWARESPNETAEIHPCYLEKRKDEDKNEDENCVCNNDNGEEGNDDDGMVWVKWSSNGLVARIPNSHVSACLPPRSARQKKATTAAAAKLSVSFDGEENITSTCSCCKPVSSTPKRKKKSCTTSKRRNTPVKDDVNRINNTSPLTKFLVEGVNSARNSSSHKGQRILEEDPIVKSRKKNPLSPFLVEGVDSTKNSSHRVNMSISSQNNNAKDNAGKMGSNEEESLVTPIVVPSSAERDHANHSSAKGNNNSSTKGNATSILGSMDAPLTIKLLCE